MLFTLQRYEFFSKSQLKRIENDSLTDVVYLAKVRIFQQITTHLEIHVILKGCCLPCKGTNFLANHNQLFKVFLLENDVVYLAKVRIFQQITTEISYDCFLPQMLFTLQRYEFFSKSQPFVEQWIDLADVVYLAKVRIFQQITTALGVLCYTCWMLFTLQRYEFFSKSQLDLVHQFEDDRCCLPCKGTNFLANHNGSKENETSDRDVVYLAKVRIFQQITTTKVKIIFKRKMLFTLQRYEFFSKSQQSNYIAPRGR